MTALIQNSKKQKLIKTLISYIYSLLMFLLIILLASAKPYIENHKFHNDDTIYLYETIVLYDTVYIETTDSNPSFFFDTLELFKKISIEKPNLFNDSLLLELYSYKRFTNLTKKPFSFDFFISPLYNNQKFYNKNIYEQAANLNNSTLSPLMGVSSGFNTVFHKKRTTLNTGVQLTIMRNNFNYLSSQYTIDTIEYYKHYQQSALQIDTIYFINIDTLLATGDTIYEIFQDSNTIYYLDSMLLKKQDTLITKKNDKATNKYIYLEIPFIIGKTYYYENISFSPEIGLIAGIIMNSKGKIVSLADLNQSTDIKAETKMAFVNLSLHAGIKIEYYINKHFNFTLKPFYRRNINSIFSNYPIIVRNNIWGTQFGLRYKF